MTVAARRKMIPQKEGMVRIECLSDDIIIDNLMTWKKGDIVNVSYGTAVVKLKEGSCKLIDPLPKKSNSNGKRKFEKNENEIGMKKIEYSDLQYNKAMKIFRDELLLKYIQDSISRHHIQDDKLKMTLFLVNVSALLEDSRLRASMALTGDSAVGKDNLIKAILKHMPKDSFIFVTSATSSVVQDDIKDYRILAVSEINLFREGGANKELLETIKQRTEGGISSIKKDLRNQNKSMRREESEQGTCIWGTTETDKDKELSTRAMTGTVEVDEKKIKAVIDKALESFSNMNILSEEIKEEDNLIRIGLTKFFHNSIQYYIYLPFIKFLKEQIEVKETIDGKEQVIKKNIFDYKNPRSQRDVKRLLALTCAMCWIFQEQRTKETINGINFIKGEVIDLINTLKISQSFFDQTYEELDQRLSAILDIIEKHEKFNNGWVDKKLIQDELEIKSRTTINEYLDKLAISHGSGQIEGKKGSDLNNEYCSNSIKTYDGNRIYYKRVQKGFKKRLVRVQLKDLQEFLERKCNEEQEKDIDDKIKRVQIKGLKIGEDSSIQQ